MEPAIKLKPIMKLIGRGIVCLNSRLTLFLLELFCTPIIKNKNKHKLKENIKKNFLNGNNIFFLIKF